MKKKGWTYAAVLFLILIITLTPGCGRKKVSSQAPSAPSAPASQVPAAKDGEKPTVKAETTELTAAHSSSNSPASNSGSLSVKPIGWGLSRNAEHKTPGVPLSWITLLNKYDGYYVGDVSGKNV